MHHSAPSIQRIGIYGGAFDPPHCAHVALARAAVTQLGLHRLYVVPTGQPWMKQRRLTDGQHRLHMAQLAFASLPEVVVSDCEIHREGTSYTIDTLHILQQQWQQEQQWERRQEQSPAWPQAQARHVISQSRQTDPLSCPIHFQYSNIHTILPIHAEWYLVMGEDLLAGLPRWQRAQELFAQVCVAVLERPDHPPGAAADIAQAQNQVPARLDQVPDRDLPACTGVHAATQTAVRTGGAQADVQAEGTQANASGATAGTIPPPMATTMARVQQALPALRTTRLVAPASTTSSTLIRHGLQQIAASQRDTRLQWLHNRVPQPVAHYIVQHQLYTPST